MTTKLTDFTLRKGYTDKTYEVVAFSTYDENEKPEVIAKGMRDKDLARAVGIFIINNRAGYTEVVIR